MLITLLLLFHSVLSQTESNLLRKSNIDVILHLSGTLEICTLPLNCFLNFVEFNGKSAWRALSFLSIFASNTDKFPFSLNEISDVSSTKVFLIFFEIAKSESLKFKMNLMPLSWPQTVSNLVTITDANTEIVVVKGKYVSVQKLFFKSQLWWRLLSLMKHIHFQLGLIM